MRSARAGCRTICGPVTFRRVAIRFQCTACGQPIEVDDEWASKPVLCPYCQKAVTAPAESQFGPIPVATALRPDAQITGETAPSPEFHAREPRRNRCAVVALMLVGVMIVQVFAISRIAAAHQDFFRELGEKIKAEVDEGTDSMVATQRTWLEHIESLGGTIPGWMQALSLLCCGMVLTWIGAVVFGIIGALRPYRRQWAVLALVLSGLTPVMFCCGGL